MEKEEKGKGGRKRLKDVQYTWRSLTQIQMNTDSNCASTSKSSSFFLPEVTDSTNVRGWGLTGQHDDDDFSTRLRNSSSR